MFADGHGGKAPIHGKDGVGGSIPPEGSTEQLTSVSASQLRVWGGLNGRCWSSWRSGWRRRSPMPNEEQFPWLTVRVLDEPTQRPCPLVRAALLLVTGSNA
jgi:hypothetical protein